MCSIYFNVLNTIAWKLRLFGNPANCLNIKKERKKNDIKMF